MSRRTWWIALGFSLVLTAGTLRAGEEAVTEGVVVAAPPPAPVALAPGNPLYDPIDFNSAEVGILAVLDVLDKRRINYVVPSGWVAREEQTEARLANLEDDRMRELLVNARNANRVTMRLKDIPLRVFLQAFADAFGVEVSFTDTDEYQVVIFSEPEGRRNAVGAFGGNMPQRIGGRIQGPGGRDNRGGNRGGNRGVNNAAPPPVDQF